MWYRVDNEKLTVFARDDDGNETDMNDGDPCETPKQLWNFIMGLYEKKILNTWIAGGLLADIDEVNK